MLQDRQRTVGVKEKAKETDTVRSLGSIVCPVGGLGENVCATTHTLLFV